MLIPKNLRTDRGVNKISNDNIQDKIFVSNNNDFLPIKLVLGWQNRPDMIYFDIIGTAVFSIDFFLYLQRSRYANPDKFIHEKSPGSASFLANIDPAKAQHLANMERLTAFMNYRNIPRRLQKRLRDYKVPLFQGASDEFIWEFLWKNIF